MFTVLEANNSGRARNFSGGQEATSQKLIHEGALSTVRLTHNKDGGLLRQIGFQLLFLLFGHKNASTDFRCSLFTLELFLQCVQELLGSLNAALKMRNVRGQLYELFFE